MDGVSPIARTPANLHNTGREFTTQLNRQDVPVDTHRPPVVDPIVRSATPTRRSRLTSAFTLAKSWWEDGPPFWGRASFGPNNVRASVPGARFADPSQLRQNIARRPYVTTAEALSSDAIPGLESDWV